MAATIDGKSRSRSSTTERPAVEKPAPAPPANLAALRARAAPASVKAQTPVETRAPAKAVGATSAPARTKGPTASRPRAPSRAEPPAVDDRPDLNAVAFEGLRGLHLSITQSNRLIAERERRGGFRSLDDLDAVPGFPRDVIAELKRHFRV